MLNKLDSETKMLWARETIDDDTPSIEKFQTFLERRWMGLEALGNVTRIKRNANPKVFLSNIAALSCP